MSASTPHDASTATAGPTTLPTIPGSTATSPTTPDLTAAGNRVAPPTGVQPAHPDGAASGVRGREDAASGARPDAGGTTGPLRVLLYSSDRTVREQVHLALGRRIAPDLPPVEIFDTATQPAVLSALATGGFDAMVLDGEATPAGGFGIAHQVKDEIVNCPPVVLLVARRDDAWLATWSRAEGVSSHPVDPLRLPRTLAEVVRATRRRESAPAAGGTVTA